MARKKPDLQTVREELFRLEQRQVDDLLLHKKLVAQLDWMSSRENPVLLEQRRWNTTPPVLPPHASGDFGTIVAAP